MKIDAEVVEINGKKHVPADQTNTIAQSMDGKQYCIVRTYSAGVFAGMVDKEEAKTGTATVYNARRLWYWDGASSLSQLAVGGTKKPNNCKFPCEVAEIILNGVIEVIPCTQLAIDSIAGVKVWAQ